MFQEARMLSDFRRIEVCVQILGRTLEPLYAAVSVLSDKSSTANTHYTTDATTSHTVYTGLEEREQTIDMRKGSAEMRHTLKKSRASEPPITQIPAYDFIQVKVRM